MPDLINSLRAAVEAERAINQAKAGPPAGTRTVTIPAREQHEGLYAITLTLPWVCLHCGGPRGEPFETVSYDGSLRLAVHGWRNPCGHIEKYSAVRIAMKKARSS